MGHGLAQADANPRHVGEAGQETAWVLPGHSGWPPVGDRQPDGATGPNYLEK